MSKLTEKELSVLQAVVAASEAHTLEGYVECVEDGEDYCTMANFEDIDAACELQEKQIAGTLASLEKKALIILCDAEAYSLGCNCWVLTDKGLNICKEAKSYQLF